MLLLEVLLFTAAGILTGIFTGLVPGLHPNTVTVIALSSSFLFGHSIYGFLAFVASMAVTNSIANFIPSIFIGAPDPETALSVLPGHRFLLRGDGYHALVLTVAGGIMVTTLTIIGLPFLIWIIPLLFTNLHAYTHILLLSVILFLLSRENGMKKAYSLLIFTVSGTMGLLLLSYLPQEGVLFPAFSGLFGISILLTSAPSGTKLPRQKTSFKAPLPAKGGVAGWVAGMAVGILPGVGSAQAGVVSNSMLRGSDRDMLAALGGINTSNIIFTFIVLHTISKTRSGAAAAAFEFIGTITQSELLFIVLVSALSCFIASIATLYIGRNAAAALCRANLRRLNLAVALSIAVLVFALTGFNGLVVCLLGTLTGLSCSSLGVKRMYLMGFLMLPTMLYFSGFYPSVLCFI